MKRIILTGLCMAAFCITGCAKSLPPHEEINLAVRKSLDASGFNYTSKSRITDLTMANPGQEDSPDSDKLRYLQSGLDVVRAFSVNVDGAVDFKGRKSEVLYDLRYSRDNVDISVKMPLLMDYNSQTIYIGTSFLNTMLDVVTPPSTETRGKLIRIPLGELLKAGTESSAELSKLFGEDRFSSRNMDIYNNVFRAGIMKAVTGLPDSRFSDLPLSVQDRKAGLERRVRINLGHDESVTVIVDMIDSMAKSLFDEGVINKSEYAVLLTLTDKKMLDEISNKITLAMIYDVGVAQSGHVGYLEYQLNVADREGNFRVGLENISSINSYDAPRFSIDPAADRTVDFMEVVKAIAAATPKGKSATPPSGEAPEKPESTEVPAPEQTEPKPAE